MIENNILEHVTLGNNEKGELKQNVPYDKCLK